jgi:hypothetical protein
MGYGLSFWPIPVMAAIESQIATGFGNPAQAVWFIPAWTLSITVCFMIWYVPDLDRSIPLCADFPSGANTDLLGRRWFLVGGNVFCFIGHLVVATAKGNKAVIVGMGLSPLHWQQQLRR